MPRSPRLQIKSRSAGRRTADRWFAKIKDKLRMNNKSRFILLLLFFNGLLVVILLLSVRNQETRQRIRRLDQEIVHQIEQLATRRAHRTQLVYITATPSPIPPPTTIPVTPTPTPTPTTASTSVVSLPTATPTRRSNTPTLIPTSTPTETPTLAPTPTATASPTPTKPPTPTWTPEPTAAPALARVMLAASSTSLPADGVSRSVIRATLLDQAGAPYRLETPVTFGTDRGTFWDAQTVVVLARDGSAEAELTSSTSAGVAHVSAQADQIPANVEVTFEPGAPHTLDLSATPLRLYVRESADLEAIVRDVHQNLVSDGTAVRFETTLGSLGSAQVPTSGGRARSALSSPAPGTAQVTAFAGPATRSVEIQFISLLSVTSVTPSQGCTDAAIQITISGAGLNPGVSARLGAWPLQILASDGDTMTAVVPAEIAVGTYDLTLSSSPGDETLLPAAYQALDCTSPDTTLDSGFLGTYGAEREFAPGQGDDDQLQVLFFEVPQTTAQPLYVRIYDPDCGGQLDKQNGQAWDSAFSFALYGASGAYTDPDARSSHPTSGALSGLPLDSVTFAQDAAVDGQWYSLGPVDATEGERVGDKRVFKLVIAGNPRSTLELSWADLNLYNVALSTSATQNVAPPGARIWAYSWTYLIPAGQARTPPHLYPYVAQGSDQLVQTNWDFDRHDQNAGLRITTPARTLQLGPEHVSGDNDLQSSGHLVQEAETGTTWSVLVWADPGQLADNLVTFWATDVHGQALALFARSTTLAPP